MIVAMTDVDKALLCSLLSYYRTVRLRGIKRVVAGELLAMVGFDDWTSNSVQMHVWLKNPHAISRDLICECFRYAYEVANVGIVIGVTPCNNTAALELNRRLGFRRVYTLKDGFALGTDLAIQELRREECRWLRHREVPSGRQIRYSTSP